ncbi:hypothetical protein LX36DRAFT_651175 [Colletotrichum falcatum]|nr:hypothetical protein LX36DRAFT_651175 [Colletotrichum falcatum]
MPMCYEIRSTTPGPKTSSEEEPGDLEGDESPSWLPLGLRQVPGQISQTGEECNERTKQNEKKFPTKKRHLRRMGDGATVASSPNKALGPDTMAPSFLNKVMLAVKPCWAAFPGCFISQRATDSGRGRRSGGVSRPVPRARRGDPGGSDGPGLRRRGDGRSPAACHAGDRKTDTPNSYTLSNTPFLLKGFFTHLTLC